MMVHLSHWTYRQNYFYESYTKRKIFMIKMMETISNKENYNQYFKII